MIDLVETQGVVSNIDDPAQAGRIRVVLPEMEGQEYPEWINPQMAPGWHWLPEVGDIVNVLLPNDDDIVEFPEEARWTGIHYDQENPPPAVLLENYGFRRGFVTLAGHHLIIDDTEGDERVSLSYKGSMLFCMTPKGMFFGTEEATEPFVLGNALKTLLSDVLDHLKVLSTTLKNHTHIGVTPGPGVSGIPSPSDVASFVAREVAFGNAKTSVDNKDQLSDFIFGQKAQPAGGS